MTRTDSKPDPAPGKAVCPPAAAATWGPWLFRASLLAALVFFWWLLAYRHGVAAPG